MASITGVNPTSSTTNSSSLLSENVNLGTTDFLQLLVTQLQNQDPLNPSSNEEFAAQLAQFSALEQMQNMNYNQQQTMAVGLLGKDITVEDLETGYAISGVVEMVKINQNIPYIYIDGTAIRLDKVGHIVMNGSDSDA